MPKGPSILGLRKVNFQVSRTKLDAAEKIVYGTDGKPMKVKVNMADGKLHDGSAQSFYFPAGHELEGRFEGMARIIEERGYENIQGLRAECRSFQCPKAPEVQDQWCCCRRLLYNEPDFITVVSLLEQECGDNGFQVIFLPKFHCELNFIEQCWVYAKRKYREYPASTSEAIMETYVIESLESVKVEMMR